MKCWNCGAQEPDPPWGKLPFRATCETCHAALHCCRNCVYYKPGLPNDCAVPGPITSPTARPQTFAKSSSCFGQGPTKTADPGQIEKKLFGEEDGKPKTRDPKKRFDSLFGDD